MVHLVNFLFAFMLSIISASNSPSCSSEHFACAHGLKCVPESFKCDRKNDCGDNSDEAEYLCTPPCSIDMFTCADGLQCVPRSKLCNGLSGCDDNSNNLPSQCDNCTADNLFACADQSRCIRQYKKCDGVAQCEDGSSQHAHTLYILFVQNYSTNHVSP